MGMHLSFGLETLDNGNILVRGHMYCKKDSRLEEDIQAVQTLIHEDCEKLLVNGPGELDELAGLPVYMFFSDKIDPSINQTYQIPIQTGVLDGRFNDYTYYTA